MISQLGSVLGVWAHPDDETFMIGGILHMAAQNGQKIACVTATRGEAGVQDTNKWPAETLGQTREAELKKALEILGATEHHWLGYPDGGCKNVDATEAVAKLVQLIEQYQPDSIITFAPDGLTGHEDHQAVSRWAMAAANVSKHRPKVWYAVHTKEQFENAFQSIDKHQNVYFNIDQPVLVPAAKCDLQINLSEKVLDTKLEALKAMPSQFENFFANISEQKARTAFASEALVDASKWDDL